MFVQEFNINFYIFGIVNNGLSDLNFIFESDRSNIFKDFEDGP